MGRSEDEQRDNARIRSGTKRLDPEQSGLSLAVADVGWFNTENLFREIDRESVDVLLLKCFDYVNGWRRGLYPWSRDCRLRRRAIRCLGAAARLAQRLDETFSPAGDAADRPLDPRVVAACSPRSRRGLVMTYPHYLYLHDQLRPDVSVYYNIDDYALYWPRAADQIRALERAMVCAADVTVCVSRLRADELRARVPEAAGANPPRSRMARPLRFWPSNR